MSSETLYKRAEHAEEIGDLDLTDAGPKEIIKATYEAWCSATKNLHIEHYPHPGPIYEAACRIIRPFGKRISGSLRADSIPSPLPGRTNGLYLSALLNETDADVLSVGKLGYEIDFIGWYMKSGKAAIVENDAKVSWLGYGAQNSTAVILGDVGITGIRSSGLNCINLGGTCLASNNRGMTFINYGHINDLCGRTDDGMLIETTGKCYYEDNRVTKILVGKNSYCVDVEDICADLPLQVMLEELESASKGSDMPKVNDGIRKVDAHVRKNYPRKIA